MTDYKEYMKTLEEQIQNKRARALVSEEINGHIEEQAQGYEEEGMSREDAKREAVRQMGDPVETGCALNRIHRPAFPWKLFVLAVLLTAASILMSVVISGKTEGGASQAEQLRALLVINGVSFAMIFVIMYFDYTWLFLHIRAVYALYMICLCLVWSGGILGNYQTALLASYSVQVLLPVIFAGIIYQYRGQGQPQGQTQGQAQPQGQTQTQPEVCAQAKKRCPSCGFETEEDYQFCPKCGQRL